MDPDGNFVDYYGQKTSVDAIVQAVHLLNAKRTVRLKKEAGQFSVLDRIKYRNVPA